MRAAVIDELGGVPSCREVPEPVPTSGQECATVRAAAIKNIERMLVAGTHYGSAAMTMPAQIGLDAVVELADGRRVYAGATPPAGAMAERLAVDPVMTVDVPDDLDDATAAALPNAGVSAWFSLEYAGGVQPGQSVLVLGGTGITGGIAAQLAKHRFQAGRVTVVGRSHERLKALENAGVDEVIGIDSDADGLAAALAEAHARTPFDLVLDYLWGAPAEQTVRALGNQRLDAAFHRTRFVQIGEMAGPTVQLPASVLRSAGIEIVGQGAGSVPRDAFGRVGAEIVPALFDMLVRGVITLGTCVYPLDEVDRAWTAATSSGTRAVLAP